MLMTKLVDYFRQRGTRRMVGETLNENRALIELIRPFGFEIHASPGEGTIELKLDLQTATPPILT